VRAFIHRRLRGLRAGRFDVDDSLDDLVATVERPDGSYRTTELPSYLGRTVGHCGNRDPSTPATSLGAPESSPEHVQQ
jgi:hypothetical protein